MATSKAMTSDLDIYRSAKLLIDQHGEDVAIFATMRAIKRAKAGDPEGRAVWLRIVDAIAEFERTRPRGDEPMH